LEITTVKRVNGKEYIPKNSALKELLIQKVRKTDLNPSVLVYDGIVVVVSLKTLRELFPEMTCHNLFLQELKLH
jgi:hypothetical protein